jgi:predicted ATP-dependent protease
MDRTIVIAVRTSSIPMDFSIFALTHIRKGNVAHVKERKRIITAYSSVERSSVVEPDDGAVAVVAIAATSLFADNSVPHVRWSKNCF